MHAKSNIFDEHSATTCPGEIVRLTFEQLKSLPFSELAGLWKEYVAVLASALVEANGQEACPAGQRVAELVEEVRLVLTASWPPTPSACTACGAAPPSFLLSPPPTTHIMQRNGACTSD